MSLTILEVLENADYNLQNAKIPFQIQLAKDQLHNAIEQINNGASLKDKFEESN